MTILFFTPYIDRTGSEFFLLNLVKSLKSNGVNAVVISKFKGDLFKEFQKHSTVYTLDRNARGFISKHYSKIKSKVVSYQKSDELFITKINKKHRPDFWYVNTMAFPEIYDLAKNLNLKVITHFHELPFQYTTIQDKQLQKIISVSKYLIGCSEVVVETLKNLGGKNVILQYEAIDPERVKISQEVKVLKNSLGINPDNYVVLMSGLRTHRKGLDLFVEVAEKLFDEKITFVWLGKELGDGFHYFVQQKIKTKNLKNILFVGERKEDYFDYVNMADLFFLSSREDPFPLVMLEAGLLGKPVISFTSGGVVEYVHEFNGKFIKGFDTDKLAQTLLEMKNVTYNKEKIILHAEKFTIQQQLPLYYSKLIALFGKNKYI